MQSFSPLHVSCCSFLLLFYSDIVIRAVSEPMNALNSTRSKRESSKYQLATRHKRAEDAWNSEDIFLCEEDDEHSMGYALTCGKNYACKMTTFSPNDKKIFKEVLDLDLLTDNCSQPFNPFYSTKAGIAANHSKLPFVVAQSEVIELEFWYNNFTHLPSRYFCKLTNTTSLSFTSNSFEGSKDLGLVGQCGKPECCLCNLEMLSLAKNKLQILNDFSFCGLSSLKSLALPSNQISHIDDNAFAELHGLNRLDMNNNRLRDLPANVFLPTNNLKHLNLNKNMLTENNLVCLRLLSALKELELSDNKIAELDIENFKSLKNLKRLVLKGNSLFHLGDVMRSLENIIILDLSTNFLSNTSELEFSSMANLSKLILGQNSFTSLHSLTFSEYADLELLDLSSNNVTSIPDFVSLKKVRQINLSHNKIRKVTKRDRANLCNITMVEQIYLNFNLIEDIVSEAFDCTGNENGLKILSLTHNRITDISNIFGSTKVQQLLLSDNNIEVLSLAQISSNIVVLDASRNNINNFSGIRPSDAYSTNDVYMRKLILQSNNISKISNVYFPHTLEQLDLKSNKLQNFTVATIKENASASIILSENIKVVDISFNRFRYMCPVIYSIVMNENMPVFRAMGNPIACPCEYAFLTAIDNQFRSFPFKCNFDADNLSKSLNLTQLSILNTSLLSSSDQFSCSSKFSKYFALCQCNLNSGYNTLCKLPCPVPCHCFLNNRYDTQVINCTHRHLSDIPHKSTIKAVIKLYFANNILTSLGPTSLEQYSSATELYFESNRLATIHPAAFQHVPQLVILNLKSNLLTRLPEGVFQNLPKLAELHLSDNRIVFIPDGVFRPLINLNVLRLDNNALENYSVWDLQDPLVGQLHVTLHNNPWTCDCNYVNQFRVWLENFSYRVDNVSKLLCSSVDGTVSQVPLISFNSTHCYDLSPTFSIFQNVPLWSSCLAVLLLLIIVSILVFLYRAEVQVLVYSRYGLRLFHHQKEDDNDKLYDAFIAYSNFDEDFVVNHILPGLEQIDKPYRTCIHQRDFMVGAIITESILEAVERSRRTIIILSDEFVKSGWCRFEFKSAHMKMLTDRCSRVIIVVLDAVPKNLDPEMQLYMKTNTYLKWGDQLFWQKLYFALPDKTPKTHATNSTAKLDVQ